MKKAVSIIMMIALVIPSVLALQITTDQTGAEPGLANINNPPATPTLTGPVDGETGTSYTYTAMTTDPDGDDIVYCFNWGDGTEFCTPTMYSSGDIASASHIWSADGDYTISVKATDENGAESAPGTLRVIMPLDINTLYLDNSYSGTLRIYIAEPESRWDNYDDNPYHYGFLDYAYNDRLSIAFGETWEETITWNAADAGYEDVTEDNIITIAAVFNPKINKAYASPPAGNSFDAHYVDAAAGVTPGETESNFKNETFTHTVFGEEITATWCPYCPAMAEALNGVYQSGDLPFYFVAMVGDKNDQVADRIEDYNLAGYPSVFFDGGRRVIVGGYEEETRYRTAIGYAGTKDVHDLDLTLSSDWNDGQVTITVVITNNEIYVNDPPATPTLTGPVDGETGTSYTYTAVTTDPDGDDLTYCFNWGDDTEFCTPTTYSSGEVAEASHIWSADGDYTISVKATDANGAESAPGTLSVTMPLDNIDDTHIVLAEMLSTTWCPNCPAAEESIDELYQTGEYPFHYVTLVIDSDPVVNPVAAKRARWLSAAYIPMLYLDGGYNVADRVTNYGADINAAAQRDVHKLDMDLSAMGMGNTEIQITVSITNMETSNYFGHLRVYVTEIESRWDDEDGHPIPYALLDFAFNKYVSIPAGETYVETTTFIGSDDHSGNTYEDISLENIQVVGSISHWMPHLQKNPWDEPKPSRFLAQYNDQAAATLVIEED